MVGARGGTGGLGRGTPPRGSGRQRDGPSGEADERPLLATAQGALLDPDDPANMGLYFSATSPGSWGNELVVRIGKVDAEDGDPPELGYLLEIGTGEGDDFEPLEAFSGVTMDPDDGQYVEAVLNDRSALVDVEHKALGDAGAGQTQALRSGSLRGFDFTTLDGRTLRLRLDNTQNVDITFDATVTDLPSAAAFIQAAVREGAQVERRARFQALPARDFRLLLVSGSRGAGSRVEATADDARADLRLDPAVAAEDGGPETIAYPSAIEAIFFGGDRGAPSTKLGDGYQDALAILKEFRDASIICLPGHAWDSDDSKVVIEEAIGHAEAMRR